ncbi:MAG: tetratricopeptide repeat protein [Bacteroidia bacterium]|jgi:TolA-binding protein|nr:tetratricopeptide repeat protein [Bacteroidia bacterium]
MKLKFIGAISLLCFLLPVAQGQKTAQHAVEQKLYRDAYELYLDEKYAPAQQLFNEFLKVSTERENSINAQYYSAVCAMELFNADAIALLTEINDKYPDHPKAKLALFQLGRFFYRNKDNKRAIQYLNQVEAINLTQEEADEYWFIKGYCYFKTDDFKGSKLSFQYIKDKKNKYFEPANYYYGYVVYKELKYDEALAHFEKIKQSKSFGPLSQVYIAQIYFARKQYEKVITLSDSITNKDVADDVAGIIGQSYFNLQQFAKALPYLINYNTNPPIPLNSADIYRVGYAYFQTGTYEKAIEQFSRITDKADTTAQFALYHLAECYIKSDKKTSARTAFERAYKLKFDREITELALFNFAKISYELNHADALKELVKFVNEFPESNYIDDARSVLGDLLMSTRNYKQAITVIESIKKQTQSNQEAYQRVLYYYAEELYINNDFNGAETYFKKSQVFDFDKKLYAQSHFWLGEIAYKQSRFSESAKLYNTFLSFENDIKFTRFYALAYYNLGYCNIKQEEFNQAVLQFKKFLETSHAINTPELYTDAALRVADCYFVSKEYFRAIDHYDMIVNKKLNGSDYALYQKAMIYGVLAKNEDKINTLKRLVNEYKKSPYIDDAVFEIAYVELQTENYSAAVDGFDNIIKNYPRSAYIKRAIQYKGLSYYNNKQEDEALATFKVLSTQYCNTEEAKNALELVEKIYINKGDLDAYLEYIKETNCKSISPSYQDSITYEAAFNQYKNGDCTKASKLMGQYINRFNGGYFFLKANYYKAECDFKLKNFDEALTAYEYVALQNRNEFTERATRQTAVLYYNKKNWKKSFEFYSALERIAGGRDNMQVAVTGMLKTSMLIMPVDSAAIYSFKYVNSGLTTKDGLLDANLIISRFYMQQEKFDSAAIGWQYLLKETKNSYAAEAKYNMAFIQFRNKDYVNAKKSIFEIAEKFASYDLWYEKSFLLLADLYTAQKDYFQAKATLQSVIENAEEGSIKSQAADKLKLIIAEEENNKVKTQPKPEKEIQKL